MFMQAVSTRSCVGKRCIVSALTRCVANINRENRRFLRLSSVGSLPLAKNALHCTSYTYLPTNPKEKLSIQADRIPQRKLCLSAHAHRVCIAHARSGKSSPRSQIKGDCPLTARKLPAPALFLPPARVPDSKRIRLGQEKLKRFVIVFFPRATELRRIQLSWVNSSRTCAARTVYTWVL